MRLAGQILGYLLLVGCCALVGFWIGGAVGLDKVSEKHIEWELVLLPNGQKARQFTTGTEPTIYSPSIYVVTEQERLLVQHLGLFDEESDWGEVSRVDVEAEDSASGKCSLEGILWSYPPQPPGTVVAQLDCVIDRIEFVQQYRYVVLDTGEVWRWTKAGSPMNEWLPMQYAFTCAAIGGLLGLALGGIAIGKVTN